MTSIALVDIYPMSVSIADAFAARGCRLIRVQSTPEIPSIYRELPEMDLFAANIVHLGTVADTATLLRRHGVEHVVPGSETGVELADELAEALRLPGNGTALGAARRNKALQQKAVRRAGVPVAESLLVTRESELTEWMDSQPGRVVIKPLRSAGNDGVTICENTQEATRAYRALLERADIFGQVNNAVLAQQYLEGTEYAVNTVSSAGRHEVTDVWRYVKMTVNGVVDRHAAARSVPPDQVPDLVEYVLNVLQALMINYGPAHVEVIRTDHGPRLVELGARMCGASASYYAEQTGAQNQVARSVDAYLDPAGFARSGSSSSPGRHAAMAFLTAPVDGTLTDYPLLPEVRRLRSFHREHIGVEPGKHLPQTVDDATEPLMIGLVHDRAEVVDADLCAVNYLDGRGFYRLAD